MKNKLNLFLNAFHFKINNALVQRRDFSGADFFINAGNTVQQGAEFNLSYLSKPPNPYSWLNSFSVSSSYAYSHFKYGDLKKDTVNFSGKFIPGVPVHAASVLADIQLANSLYFNFSYYFNSKQFLNDANNLTADAYHLAGLRIGWHKSFLNNYRFNLYFGIDNLFNEVYSLGNDINDPRGRAFNASASRNFYTGLAFQFAGNKKK